MGGCLFYFLYFAVVLLVVLLCLLCLCMVAGCRGGWWVKVPLYDLIHKNNVFVKCVKILWLFYHCFLGCLSVNIALNSLFLLGF